MKTLALLIGSITLSGCAMTPQEMEALSASMNQVNNSAQNWGQQFRQQGQQYVAPQAVPYGNWGRVNYTRMGDSLMGSNGVTYRIVGNSILGSDGTTCHAAGQILMCR